MPNDHYVAKTYLKHFADPKGFMRAYRKSDLTNFPCKPADICHELGGDIVPDFLPSPKALGEFRQIFEPHWNLALEHLLLDMNPADDVKLAIAGYAANLLGATPAMKRVTIKSHNQSVVENMRAAQILKARHRDADLDIVEAIKMIDAGEIIVETEPDWARATNTRHLISFASRLYNADWIVLRNLTSVNFLTSDNPFVFDDPGPFRGGGSLRLPRYLPLTPRFCLYITMDPDRDPGRVDLTKPPLGTVRFATCDKLARIEHINKLIIQGAEEFVISTGPSDALEPLVAKYAKHRISNEFITIMQSDGIIHGLRMRVWDPAAYVAKWT
ncbi:MAG: hypothetical protein JWQ22_1766, partial [Devosia sp.]|nr:hypothetical protein [Devosia sp.]